LVISAVPADRLAVAVQRLELVADRRHVAEELQASAYIATVASLAFAAPPTRSECPGGSAEQVERAAMRNAGRRSWEPPREHGRQICSASSRLHALGDRGKAKP